MNPSVPRLVLAGTNSGCGKTTVTCAILQAFVNRGLQMGACKCGPDYIDPMFHSRIIGARSTNLDLFFFDPNTLRYLLAENGRGCDLSIIEGVMGYYDGMGLTSDRASSYEVARVTDSPVVLVVNARGLSLSILAILEGFVDLRPDSHIAGVILNQCTAMTYKALAGAIEAHFGGKIKPLGYLPVLPDCTLESRHLGLVTAQEVTDLKEKLQILAEQAEKSIDLDGLLALGRQAPALSCEAISVPVLPEPVRIAVAKDKAFCFYYADSLGLLEKMGAELRYFSPLEDESLPDCDGLYLGGGYPELYAEQLSRNETMRQSIRTALDRGLPCIAECGGFLYLTEAIGDYPMVGLLPSRSYDAGKLVRFGYVNLTAKTDNLLCAAGDSIRGHEFHHWDTTDSGSCFTARRVSGKAWDCVVATDTLYAGFPHFHFYSNPAFAEHFCRACLKEAHRHA